MFPAKAKRVIFLYMSGGVSHVDTFDPKPRLTADHGKEHNGLFLHATKYKYSRYAKCDTEVSELFPNVGAMMDELISASSVREVRNPQPFAGRHAESTSPRSRPASIGSFEAR